MENTIRAYRVYNPFGYDFVSEVKPDHDLWDLYEFDLFDFSIGRNMVGDLLIDVNGSTYIFTDLVRFEGADAVLLVPAPYPTKNIKLKAKKKY